MGRIEDVRMKRMEGVRMKRMEDVRMKGVLVVEAVGCVIFCLLRGEVPGVFSGVAAFPFEQIGMGLRWLSLSGGIGNGAAIVLYILLSLVPCLVWAYMEKRGAARGIDWMLLGLSLLLFAVNYYMVNPGLFVTGVPGAGKMVLGSVFYSALSGYLIIRALLMCQSAGEERLWKWIRGLCGFLNVVLVYLISWTCFGDFLDAVREVQAGDGGIYGENVMSGIREYGVTYLFLGGHYLINVLPYVFDIGIVFLSIHMLTALEDDRYSAGAAEKADRLASFCGRALVITVSADVVFNILQMIFHERLYQTDIVIRVPVISIVFVLAVLLFARYVREDQKLKQENDLFI